MMDRPPPCPELAITRLRRLDPRRNMARYYTVAVEPTLFGEFAVTIRYGRLGSWGRSRAALVASWGDGEVLRMKQVSAKLRRGYTTARRLATIVAPCSSISRPD